MEGRVKGGENCGMVSSRSFVVEIWGSGDNCWFCFLFFVCVCVCENWNRVIFRYSLRNV